MMAMIVLAWFGGIIILAVAGAAIYDFRANRRGLRTGPTGVVRKQLGVNGSAPYGQHGMDVLSEDTQRQQTLGGG